MSEFVVTGPGSFFIGAGDDYSGPERVLGVSPFVTEQFPRYVKRDHPGIVAFTEAYYEWLETKGQALYGSRVLLRNQDIDRTVEDFVEYFRKEFLVEIPATTLSNPRFLAKHIRDFYLSRGTEKSYRFLFRILYNKEIEFYYPSRDILRVDDGVWVQYRTIRIIATSGKNPFDLTEQTVTGQASGATGFVERVNKFQVGVYTVYELFFFWNSVSGEFQVDESILLNGEVYGRTYPIITGFNLSNPGTGYSVGDTIEATDIAGLGAVLKIRDVDPSGKIKKIDVISPGVGYSPSPTPVFIGSGSSAAGSFTVGALVQYPGFYLDDRGWPDSTKKFQNDYFYQQFSYQILVDESLNYYKEVVQRLLHPSGTIMFGGILLIAYIKAKIKPATDSGYTDTLAEIDNEIFSQMLAPTIPQHAVDLSRHECEIAIESTKKEDTFGLGPSLWSIERFKSTFLPSELYPNENSQMTPPNSDYWLQFANYQVKDAAEIILSDIGEKPWKKYNVCPDPYLLPSIVTEALLADFAAIGLTSDFIPDIGDDVDVTGGRVSELRDNRAIVNEFVSFGGERPYLTRNDNKENQFLYSEDFSDASWSKTNVTVSTNVIANPVNLTVTADEIIETTDTGEHSVTFSGLVFSSQQDYVFTINVKSTTIDWVKLEVPSAVKVNGYGIFQLSTNSVISGAGASSSISIVESDPTWKKISIRVRASSDQISYVKLTFGQSASNFSYAGNTGRSAYVWGAQFRDARASSEYLPTTGEPQFRGVNGTYRAIKFIGGQQMDSVTTLDDIFNDDAQVVHIVFRPDMASQSKGIIAADSNAMWEIYVENNSVVLRFNDGSYHTLSRSIFSGVTYIVRIRMEAGIMYFSLNGGGELLQPCGDVNAVNGTLSIGGVDSDDYFYGDIVRITTDVSQTTAEMNTVFFLFNILYAF